MIKNNFKIFLVEFGQPTIGTSFGNFGKENDFLIIAESYDEAVNKAIKHKKENIEPKDTIFDSDGSLKKIKEERNPLSISSVKMLTDKIIW